MTGYRLTPDAADDLFDIWSFIARNSPDSADRVEESILSACEQLTKNPLIGTVRADLTALPVRFWAVPSFRNYLVVYDPAVQPLQIIRILHGARDVPSVLS